jgi:hypothetical protein
MKNLHASRLVVAVTLIGSGLLAGPSAFAQKVTLPDESVKARPDLSVATRQLRMADELGRRVLQSYRAALANDGIPIDEALVQPARNAYALIRAANESMELRKQYMKYPDPVFELAHKRVGEAWNLSRTPVDKYNWTRERNNYLSTSIRDLDRALQLVEQALVLLP